MATETLNLQKKYFKNHHRIHKEDEAESLQKCSQQLPLQNYFFIAVAHVPLSLWQLGFHRLIMGKELIAGIFTKVLQKCSYSSPLLYFKLLNSIFTMATTTLNLKKKNHLLISHKEDEAKSLHNICHHKIFVFYCHSPCAFITMTT